MLLCELCDEKAAEGLTKGRSIIAPYINRPYQGARHASETCHFCHNLPGKHIPVMNSLHLLLKGVGIWRWPRNLSTPNQKNQQAIHRFFLHSLSFGSTNLKPIYLLTFPLQNLGE